MPVLDEPSLQVNHKHVEGVDSNALVADHDVLADCTQFLVFLGQNLDVAVADVKLIVPVDEIHRFFGGVIDLDREQVVPKSLLLFIGKHVEVVLVGKDVLDARYLFLVVKVDLKLLFHIDVQDIHG